MLFSIDFGNVFILISLNVSNIELEEDLDIDESEEFNIGVQTYLIFKREYEEFTVMGVNLSTAKNNDEEYLHDEDDPYLEPNNIRHYDIVQINCIYDYCVFYLEFKAINNFFSRAIFRLIKKIYIEKETRYQIFTIRTAIYRTFIPSSKHLLIYVKEGAILKRY